MKLKILTATLAVATCISGCTSTGWRDSFSRSTAAITGRNAKSSHESFSESLETKLSDEFKVAQKSLKHPEEMLLVHAQLMEDHEEYADARQRYREIITAYPKNVDAGIGLARVELKTGRVEQAEQILADYDTRFPENTAVKQAYGQLMLETDRVNEAASLFAKAADIDPQDQAVRYNLGLALARMEQYDAAIPHLTFAVGKSAAMYNVGYLLSQEGRTSEARTWLNAAMQNSPDERTKQQAGELLAQLGSDPRHQGESAVAQASAAFGGGPTGNAYGPTLSQPPQLSLQQQAYAAQLAMQQHATQQQLQAQQPLQAQQQAPGTLPARFAMAAPQAPGATVPASSAMPTGQSAIQTTSWARVLPDTAAPAVISPATASMTPTVMPSAGAHPTTRSTQSWQATTPAPAMHQSAAPVSSAIPATQDPPMWRSRNQ